MNIVDEVRKLRLCITELEEENEKLRERIYALKKEIEDLKKSPVISATWEEKQIG
jgi:cell division protein FtsB